MQVKKLLTLKEMSEQRMETDCGVRGGGLCEGKCNTQLNQQAESVVTLSLTL